MTLLLSCVIVYNYKSCFKYYSEFKLKYRYEFQGEVVNLKKPTNSKNAVIAKQQSAKSITTLRKEITTIKKKVTNFKAKEPFSTFLADFKSARSK